MRSLESNKPSGDADGIKCSLRISVITLFPEMFASLTQSGVSGRAFEQGLVALKLVNPRDFADDKHRTVDDRPYGGGPGMVMKPEPFFEDVADGQVDKAQLKLAEDLVKNNTAPLDTSAFRDRYQEALLDVINAKVEGKEPAII